MRVALTFDAETQGREHHSPEAPLRILDTLRTFEVKATFFMQGRWCRSEPRLAREVVADGHLIGNHSFFHAAMDRLKDPLQEVLGGEGVIREMAGADPRPWFRCPFGTTWPFMDAGLKTIGYQHVGWTIEAADWEPAVPAAQIANTVMKARDGDIVLLHTWPSTTATALPYIVEHMLDAGTEFVTVDELLAVTA